MEATVAALMVPVVMPSRVFRAVAVADVSVTVKA